MSWGAEPFANGEGWRWVINPVPDCDHGWGWQVWVTMRPIPILMPVQGRGQQCEKCGMWRVITEEGPCVDFGEDQHRITVMFPEPGSPCEECGHFAMTHGASICRWVDDGVRCACPSFVFWGQEWDISESAMMNPGPRLVQFPMVITP